MLLLLLLLPYGALSCIPMKVIDRGIPAVPGGGGGGPAAQVTGCKAEAIKSISQADLDNRYGVTPPTVCVTPTITATSVTCNDPAAQTFVYQLPDGGVNGGGFFEASCAAEMWSLVGFVGPSTEKYPYLGACCVA